MYDKHLNSGILCMAVELEMGFKGSIFLAFFTKKKQKTSKVQILGFLYFF